MTLKFEKVMGSRPSSPTSKEPENASLVDRCIEFRKGLNVDPSPYIKGCCHFHIVRRGHLITMNVTSRETFQI